MKEGTKKICAWFGGIFLICSAITYINQILVPSILILISGIIILPPMNRKIKEKISEKNIFSRYGLIRNIIIIMSILIFASNVPGLNDIDINTNNHQVDENIEQVNKSVIEETDTKETKETNGIYTGQRSNGKKEGKGKFEWNDGSIYEGEFHNDKIEGMGDLTIPDKGTYHGLFKDGKKNGEGIYNFSNGDMYNGNWVDDKMSGKGTYIFANQEYYEGYFLDNQFNGEGTYHTNSSYYKGTWKNNEYKK